MNSYNIRKQRFDLIKNSWNLVKKHDLFLYHELSQELLNELKLSIMLYISKAMNFEFTFDEDLFIERLEKNKDFRDNITPNGAIVPKKEYQLEYNMVLRSWSRILLEIVGTKPELIKKFRMTPNVRIKFGTEIEENVGRALNTSWPHSDAWLDGPWGINCFIPILGDIKKNNLAFYIPKDETQFQDTFLDTAKTYEEKQWVLDYYKMVPELFPEKGKIHLSDYALIHGSYREESCGTRISLDTTLFVGDYDVHMDRETEYSNEIQIIGENILVSSNRSTKDKIISNKKSIYSHYTTGTLTFHKC